MEHLYFEKWNWLSIEAANLGVDDNPLKSLKNVPFLPQTTDCYFADDARAIRPFSLKEREECVLIALFGRGSILVDGQERLRLDDPATGLYLRGPLSWKWTEVSSNSVLFVLNSASLP